MKNKKLSKFLSCPIVEKKIYSRIWKGCKIPRPPDETWNWSASRRELLLLKRDYSIFRDDSNNTIVYLIGQI